MERDRAQDHADRLAIPHTLNDEQVDANRRGDLPEFNEHHQDYAEPDRIDTVPCQRGKSTGTVITIIPMLSIKQPNTV